MDDKVLFKKNMHSVSNKIAYFIIYPIVIVFALLAYRDRANDEIFFICLPIFILLLLFYSYVFIIRFKVFGKLYFYEEKIVMKNVFKEEVFKYEEYVAVVGKYTSIIESKKWFILTPIRINRVVTIVDTSKSGNITILNKNKVLYCAFDDELLGFLDNKM